MTEDLKAFLAKLEALSRWNSTNFYRGYLHWNDVQALINEARGEPPPEPDKKPS